MKYHVVYIGIILTLFIVLFRSECNRDVKPNDEVKIDGKKYDVVDVNIDTVYVKAEPDIRYKPGKTIYRDTVIYQKVHGYSLGDIAKDMQEKFYDSILMSHFAKSVFKDTITFGGIGNVYITDTIQENAILSREVNSDLIFKAQNKTITVKEKLKNELYLGAKTMIMNGGISGVGSGLILKTKRQRMYGVGAMIDRQKNLNFAIDFYIKL